jgi:serine/threonine-protein kinase
VAAPDVVDGRYRILGVLGQGGMATVYDGWDLRLGRPVAIKLLHPGLSGQPEFRARMQFEARSAAALNHPNIVVVHDSGDDLRHGGAPYLIMERLPGRSLLEAIAPGPLTPDHVRRVLCEVLAGLGAAHAAGILHRDVKPANVLFGAAGEAKIADFGVAKTGGTDLTQTGLVVGTMAYLSPDRISGRPATPLDDLYAVGAVGYEALTGRMPFPHREPMALMQAIAAHDLAPLQAVRPDVDPVLTSVIDRAMAPNPADRFPSAEAMHAALLGRRPPTRVLTMPMAPAPSRRRKTLALLAIAAVAVAAVVAVVAASVSSQSTTSVTPAETTTQPTVPTTTTTTAVTTSVVDTMPGQQGNGHRNGGSKKPKHGEGG